MFGIIYISTNKTNGKNYIGQTTNPLNKRIQNHISRKLNLPFSNALKKYGIENFEWFILEKCDNKEQLDEMEFHFIKQYNSLKPNGYNLTLGGEGTSGYTHNEKSKENMSKAQNKRYLIKTEKKKISEKQKKNWLDKNYREKQTEKIRKTCRKKEHRKNKSLQQKKMWQDEEYIANRKKLINSNSYRKKLSNSIKKSWQNNNQRREKTSKLMKELRKKDKGNREKINKKWEINGNLINDLKSWCNKHNINYNTFYYYKNKSKTYKGYSLKLIEEREKK